MLGCALIDGVKAPRVVRFVVYAIPHIVRRSLALPAPGRYVAAVSAALLLGGIALYDLAGIAHASGTITVSPPTGATTCSARFSSQDVYNTVFNWTPPPSGGPSMTERINNLGLDYWRIQAVDDAGASANSIPFPQAYTGTDGQSIGAWKFNILDKMLSDGPDGVPRLLDITRPPDSLWTGTGGLYSGSGTPGTFADQTYGVLGQYMADLVTYFRTGVLETNSGGTVTYGATTLTDTAKDFTAYGGGGYAVTVTVDDTNGFPDWETANVTGVTNSGHTLNLSGWSITSSNNLSGSTTPAGGAAYNLASATPPLTSPTNATPWPRPPSVGDVQYYELFNEPDLSSYTYPRTSPSLPAPTPVLTGVNVAGGTLTPGNTYAYRMTAVNIGTEESLPGTEVSITLPGGDNAVQLSWSATSNLGLSPFAYRIYGRTSGLEQAMVVVGKDAAGGLTWTDGGTTATSGALPTADNTPGFQVWRAREYTKMWNKVVPMMKAIDSTIKAVGPTISNPQSLAVTDTDTTVVTTGTSDNSWRDSTDYIPYLMANGVPTPDVVSFHNYGWWEGSVSTDSNYFQGLQNGINDYLSIDNSSVGSVPAWVTEMNVDAGFLDNNDYRSMTQLGSAWLADNYIQWCSQAPTIEQLFQFEAMNGNTWNLFAGSDAPANCYPQPSCLNIKASEPDLEYWLIYWLSRYFPAGSTVAPVSGTPSGYAAFAVRPPSSTKISVIVVNTQVGTNPGEGVAGNVSVQLSGATSSSTEQVMIDGSTDVTNGPSASALGGVNTVSLSLSGYGVAILSFDTAADTTPPSVPSNLHVTAKTSSSVSLAWNASTDSQSGVAGYKIYQNGSLKKTVTSGTSAAITGLSASTSYTYKISAYDNNGNESAQSSSVSATTSAASSSVQGDCNGDSHVNVFDLSILLGHYSGSYSPCDFNHDGVVNVFDLSILLSNYGK